MAGGGSWRPARLAASSAEGPGRGAVAEPGATRDDEARDATSRVGPWPASRRDAGPGAAAGEARPGLGCGLARWWPLALLMVVAAALRFSTLSLQSLWFDEAFTVVHVFKGGLGATLSQIPHTENTPPLWYILEWAIIQIAGNGAAALRFLSALAGLATVPVAYGIGSELAGRRAAILAAGFVAVSPLFVWYSQEARAYSLFAFFCALAIWCCLRAERKPSRGSFAAFAVVSALALLTHYFAVFLVVPMALWLLRRRERISLALPALLAIGAVGAALLPLALAQGGRGAEWIGNLTLVSRVEAIPQYYLTGYSGAPLGRGIELAVALPLLAGLAYGLWRMLDPLHTDHRSVRGALLMLGLFACGVGLPLLLVLFGADYLDPRNVIGAMIPAAACLAVVIGVSRAGRLGMAFGVVAMLAMLAISVDVDLSPRLQRGDWNGVAGILRRDATSTPSQRAIVSVHLGTAPLEYYLSPLRGLPAGASLSLRQIDEVGYPQLAEGAASPPVQGFRLRSRRQVHGLYVYTFDSATPQVVSVSALLAHPFTLNQGKSEVLAPPGS